jgi:hypothetical protein
MHQHDEETDMDSPRPLPAPLLAALILALILEGCAGQKASTDPELAANEAACARLADEIVTVARWDDCATRVAVHDVCLRERNRPWP